jgi:hypothetical protein
LRASGRATGRANGRRQACRATRTPEQVPRSLSERSCPTAPEAVVAMDLGAGCG